MKRIFFVFLITVLSLSCSDEPYDFVSVEGVWKLTAYEVEQGFDINNDGVKNTNLLEELECPNNETLMFESNGVVSSMATFNPSIQIAVLNQASDDYTFQVTCDFEGVIGFAANYTQNDVTITYNNHSGVIIDNKLYIVFKDAIEIFNENYSQVIETQDVTLVYSKQL